MRRAAGRSARLDLLVDRRVLIPRPETEVVAGLALDELDRCARAPRQGTGRSRRSTSAPAPGPSGWPWRPSASGSTCGSPTPRADALAVARANLVGPRRPATRVRIAEGEWFAALPPELPGHRRRGRLQPALRRDHDELPEAVATGSRRRPLRRAGRRSTTWASSSPRPCWLAPGGALVLELAPHQAQAVAARARDRGFAEAEVRPTSPVATAPWWPGLEALSLRIRKLSPRGQRGRCSPAGGRCCCRPTPSTAWPCGPTGRAPSTSWPRSRTAPPSSRWPSWWLRSSKPRSWASYPTGPVR